MYKDGSLEVPLLYASLLLSPAWSAPDLETSVTGIGCNPSQGYSFVSALVENYGDTSADGFYIDMWQGRTTAATIGMYSPRAAWIPGLGPDEWVQVTWIPSEPELPWTGWFDVLVDSDCFISESREDNNTLRQMKSYTCTQTTRPVARRHTILIGSYTEPTDTWQEWTVWE
jgi:hypothetical protein